METQTIQQAREGLSKEIQGFTNFGEFKMPDDPSPASSESDSTLNNSPEAHEAEGTENRSNSAESEAQTSSRQDSPDGVTQEEGAASNQTDTTRQQLQQPKKKGSERIQALANEVRELKKALEESKKVQAPVIKAEAKDSKAEEPKPLIPPPEKPKYTKQQIIQLMAKAKADGDENLVALAGEELEKIRDYDLELVRWETKNARAFEQHQAAINHYKTEALKKWPTLSDPNSEHSKSYIGIRGWLNEQLPDLLTKPHSDYLVALIADWKTSSGRLAAVQTELQTLRDENQKLKKAGQPLTTTGKTEVGKGEPSINDAKEELRNSIRQHTASLAIR